LELQQTLSDDRLMPRRQPRDLERTYSVRQFSAKLRRLADALESGKAFTIQVAGEVLRIPAGTEVNVEHERGADGSEELEFQLRWRRDPGA
jgi:amphi-Trp domain-containing protein